jgi:hypothetical protein
LTKVIPSYYTREGEEARYSFGMNLWRQAPADMRIPLLIETLECYGNPCGVEIKDAPLDDPVAMIRSGRGLNDLIIAAYRLASGREAKKLCMAPDEQQSFAILRAAHHYCGHGEDTTPPLRFALRHFRRKLYSEEFFDSLSAYRECLAHTKHTATQRLKAEIDLILWQDLRVSDSGCWTARIRSGLRGFQGAELALWRFLFQRFCYSTIPAPPRHWRIENAVNAIGHDRCAEVLLEWIAEETSDHPVLTASGSAVVKNLVWLAELLRCADLDRALHRVLFLPWKKAQTASKVAVALAWLWSRRDGQANNLVRITEILERFGSGGEQIERIWRESGGTEPPSGFVAAAEMRSQILAEPRLSVNRLARIPLP